MVTRLLVLATSIVCILLDIGGWLEGALAGWLRAAGAAGAYYGIAHHY